MSNYQDRGIIKWAPFDGLSTFNDLYNQLKYRLNKKDKPILSEEQLHYMNLTLQEAIINQNEITIAYFKDGYVNNLYGHITKLDPIKKAIYLDGVSLKIDSIVNLELI